MDRSIWSRAGVATSAAPAASLGHPVAGGAGAVATRTVGALVSLPEPLAFVAGTLTRIVLPTSELRTRHVLAAAPLTSWQEFPFAPHTRHWSASSRGKTGSYGGFTNAYASLTDGNPCVESTRSSVMIVMAS